MLTALTVLFNLTSCPLVRAVTIDCGHMIIFGYNSHDSAMYHLRTQPAPPPAYTEAVTVLFLVISLNYQNYFETHQPNTQFTQKKKRLYL